VSPWTGNSHEVSGQFADDHLDLFMGRFTEDMCEDGMKHLWLNAFGRKRFGSHHLGGMGSRSAKGRCLVGSDDDTDDANEKCTGSSVTVLGMCGNIGNGHAAHNGNGTFNWRFGCKFKVADFHWGVQ
jgi:hypothetical protein